MKILITGVAGFIGYHVAKSLVNTENEIITIDNINDYYDVNLKYSRLHKLGINTKELKENQTIQSEIYENLNFQVCNIENTTQIKNLFEKHKFDLVCHLAAQAGVRYSIENPHKYAESNIIGFLNILENSKNNQVKHLAYASSSSVYGLNESMPLSINDNTNHPVSLYAATKKSNELMAHSYSHLFNLPTTGMRFFTVYGPWGRPDMSPMIFADAILNNKIIKIYNNGQMMRDYTYIDDIVEGINKILFTPAKTNMHWDKCNPKSSSSTAPYRIYNLGNSNPITLVEFITQLEIVFEKQAKKEYLPLQPGDVINTYADITETKQFFQFHPKTQIENGLKYFAEWYKSYYTK